MSKAAFNARNDTYDKCTYCVDSDIYKCYLNPV